MCLCNIESPVEFLNMTSNEDQRDPIEDSLEKQLSRMDRRTFTEELAKKAKAQFEVEQLKLEMFPNLLSIAKTLHTCFYAMVATAGKPLTEGQAKDANGVLKEAREAIAICEKLVHGERQ